jgi:hypothetical protein
MRVVKVKPADQAGPIAFKMDDPREWQRAVDQIQDLLDGGYGVIVTPAEMTEEAFSKLPEHHGW